mmetsp:Transcript_79843/g.165980  ORF Transcript_79843/g.165980 Transcript_79843/m.165980 type:complete len:879 (-) Transcript_79843:46-2682(-)
MLSWVRNALHHSSSGALTEREREPLVTEEVHQIDPYHSPANDTSFMWNNRECHGVALHQAVLDEDYDKVVKFLDEEAGFVSRRFYYETVFNKKAQEGSGEPIHLAVSRKSVKIVELLIERQAALDAMVTRDHKPHYDVLHAAVFREGLGGDYDIVKTLLDAKAAPSQNLDGHWPLHKAYQTGGEAFNIIPLLRDDMDSRGLLTEVEENPDKETPLQLGIRMRKLTGQQLSQVASLTGFTLKTFVKSEPHSIIHFVERFQSHHDNDAKALAALIGPQELCETLRSFPKAGLKLLEATTAQPEAENPGRHPLPTRMSFAANGFIERCRFLFNPPAEMHAHICSDSAWLGSSPAWHAKFRSRQGKPVYDVNIQVCYLDGLASADFLDAVLEADDDEIYLNRMTKGVIDVVWWGGAFKIDLLQLCITIIGLLLLIWDRYVFDLLEASEEENRHAFNETADLRLLRPHGGIDPAVDGPGGSHVHGFVPHSARVFIGARGILDLLHEFLQIFGYFKRGEGWKYLDLGNMYDITRAIMAFLFYFNPTNSCLQMFLICIYWFRLLEVSVSENMMRELLPITCLVEGLGPSFAVFCVAMAASAHAEWVLTDLPLWPDVIHQTFALLITAELPAVTVSGFNLSISYALVLAFSVFFLNIFIGVIGENYSAYKEAVTASLLKKKAGLCYTFLMRAEFLPTHLVPRPVALATTMFGFLLLTIGVFCEILGKRYMHPICLFLPGLSICFLACYQDKEDLWSGALGNRNGCCCSRGAYQVVDDSDRLESNYSAAVIDSNPKPLHAISSVSTNRLSRLVRSTEWSGPPGLAYVWVCERLQREDISEEDTLQASIDDLKEKIETLQAMLENSSASDHAGHTVSMLARKAPVHPE